MSIHPNPHLADPSNSSADSISSLSPLLPFPAHISSPDPRHHVSYLRKHRVRLPQRLGSRNPFVDFYGVRESMMLSSKQTGEASAEDQCAPEIPKKVNLKTKTKKGKLLQQKKSDGYILRTHPLSHGTPSRSLTRLFLHHSHSHHSHAPPALRAIFPVILPIRVEMGYEFTGEGGYEEGRYGRRRKWVYITIPFGVDDGREEWKWRRWNGEWGVFGAKLQSEGDVDEEEEDEEDKRVASARQEISGSVSGKDVEHPRNPGGDSVKTASGNEPQVLTFELEAPKQPKKHRHSQIDNLSTSSSSSSASASSLPPPSLRPRQNNPALKRKPTPGGILLRVRPHWRFRYLLHTKCGEVCLAFRVLNRDEIKRERRRWGGRFELDKEEQDDVGMEGEEWVSEEERRVYEELFEREIDGSETEEWKEGKREEEGIDECLFWWGQRRR